jgi:hypothetical protein
MKVNQEIIQGENVLSKFLILTGVLWLGLTASPVQAHPVAFAGSYSIMAWNSKETTDWMLTHSFTSTYSLSAHYQRVETKEGKREYFFPHLNFLLKRWNELDSQANIYLSVGHGAEKIKNDYKDTSFLAMEADWESRKYYVSFKQEALINHKNSNRNFYMSRVRAGFAPYLAEFNELNTWFIVQVDKSNKGMDEYSLTPIIRMFYHNVLTEFGVNQKGDSLFNFMVHF